VWDHEGPYDVAKDDDTRLLISAFPRAETDAMLAKVSTWLRDDVGCKDLTS
jgi:hypothetical protein